MKKVKLIILGIFLYAQLYAQTSGLNLEQIYSTGEFSSERSKSLRWFDNGDAYTTLEPSAEYERYRNIVRNDTKSGDQKIIVPVEWMIPSGATEPLRISNYTWSDDKSKLLLFTNTKRVWRYHTKGDYYVLDIKTKKLLKIGGEVALPSETMFAKFSPDATRIGFVMKHNIYVESLVDGSIVQLTKDGTDKIINGTFDWVYEEEFSCRDGFRWSPDGQKIAYWRIDASTTRDFLMINNTDSVYSRIIPVQYPKAGEKPSEAKVGVVSAKGGETKWMHLEGPADNQYIPRFIWTQNSDAILVQHLNRAQNHNKVTRCDVSEGKAQVIFEDKETAWLEVVNDYQFLENSETFTWVSEKSGWKSCYLVTDGKANRITPENYDMISVSLIDEKGGWLYFIASPDNATQKYLYRTKLNGNGKAQRLTPKDQSGTHNYALSPNGKYASHTFSSAGVPPVTNIISLPDHRIVSNLVENKDLKNRMAQLQRYPTEFFEIKLDDGASLDAYMIKPADFNPALKYPVLFHVYGEPWGQTVLDSWGGSTYLWHLMLAQQGYLIMSIDNRGTPAPKGRDWRKCVYGQIGVLSSADQANGVKKITDMYDFVDPERIAIWGWSGGGSMTLNALFRYPDMYHTGMAVAPVGNQLLYDNIYQERYSGVPQDMPESYKMGSPMNFAKNLEGNLLIMHGTGDDNVHYQNTEVVVNELIKHNKIFSMMAYPNRSHGIYEGENTSRHVREILTNYLMKNLPNEAR